MSMGVAYPACIVAEMVVKGEITGEGILSPATDIPCDVFMDRLNEKGITIKEAIESGP
jgi:saccharopine dehydrogenase-like NADP-dependent oxidoreductase